MNERHPFHTLLPPQVAPLHRRALSLASNPHLAEDLVQETLMKAWASRDRYVPETNLRAWLFTILRNTFFSELRKYRREVEDVDGLKAAALFEDARQDHAIDLGRLIVRIGQLPEAQRRPILMMGMYGYSQLEVADACKVSLGTVKSRVSRGRSTLGRVMAQGDRAGRTESLHAAE